MKVITGFLLMFFSLFVQANSLMTINVDASQAQFSISLPANPTTGYQWSVEKFDKKYFKLIKSNFKSPSTKRIGASGEMIFTFQCHSRNTCPKSTKMIFKYARPWEKGEGKLQKVLIHFKAPPKRNFNGR